MKTLTIAVLALALCGCSFSMDEKAHTEQARHTGYLEGYIDGKDGRPPTPDAPNSRIGQPEWLSRLESVLDEHAKRLLSTGPEEAG